MKTILSCLTLMLWCLFITSISAQKLSEIEIPHRCIYSTKDFQDTFVTTDFVSTSVEQKVREICQRANVEKNFEVVSSYLPSISAIVSPDKKYLTYSRIALLKIEKQEPLLYFILAHEIAHLVLNHKLDNRFRLQEEMEADEFAGRVLFKILNNRPELLKQVKEHDFAFSDILKFSERVIKIEEGWERSDIILQSKSNLGYLKNKLNNANLPLPLYVPTGCPQSFEIPRDTFESCENLGDVNAILSSTLENGGYEKKSYYFIEDGFALFCPLEQINDQGTPLLGEERWHDYPANKNFEGLMEYFKSLVVPQHGYFRIFVFEVTKQHTAHENEEVDAEQALEWLIAGGRFLPAEIQEITIDSTYHMILNVYEFKAPQSTKILGELCTNNLLSPREHFDLFWDWERD